MKIGNQRMHDRLIAAIALGWLALVAACGNYSSEDVEYQLALPEQEDLSAKLPTQQALVADADQAEYYRETRKSVRQFNELAWALLKMIDFVRSLPPSERKPGLRVWGPYPHDRDPRWEVGMAMEQKVDPTVPRFGYRFVYAIKFRPRGAGAAAWKDILQGSFSPTGGVRQGMGQLVLDLAAARAAGHPHGFGDLTRLTIDYETSGFPVKVKMSFWNVAAGPDPAATYSYTENVDNSGEMAFAYRMPEQLGDATLMLRSRWQGAGAGQAEARGMVGGKALLGVDCWGPDGRATYKDRNWIPQVQASLSDRSSCVFGAP